ncbi:MAG TPA: SgcJ/EcaC family oxidoreductase [Rhizomicrobium sp.]
MKWTRLAAAALFCTAANPVLAQTHAPALRIAARHLLSSFAHAWNAGDAPALARNFAPDADFVGPDGMRAFGRRAIRAFYGAAFAHGYSGSRSTGDLRFVRKIAPDLAIVDASWRIEGARKADGLPRPAETGILVAVLRKHAERWSVLALRENEGAADIQSFARP